MEMIFFAIFGGMFFSFLIFAIGMWANETIYQRKLNRHSSDPVRDRVADRGDRSDTVHHQPTPAEIVIILYNLRIGASQHEKQIIDYLIDREEKQYNAKTMVK